MADHEATQERSLKVEDQLTHLLTARYGYTPAQLTSLGGEHDWNYRCIDTNGDVSFVRLTPAWVGDETVEWQNRVLLRLEEAPLSVHSPRLLAQQDGAIMSEHPIVDDEMMTLRVTTWVPGSGISSLGEISSGARHQIGQVAAEIVQRLEPLGKAYRGSNEHHWMVTRSGDSIRETMHAVTDTRQQRLIQEALCRFDEVAPRIAELPFGVTHQDLHDFNILAETDDEGSTRVTGIVDFNDAVYTVRVAEVAVAAAYAGLRQADPFTAFTEVLTGYLSRTSLIDAELSALYPLAVARLAVNASTWTYRAAEANRDYALARTAATWPALEAFLDVTPADAEAVFAGVREERGERLGA